MISVWDVVVADEVDGVGNAFLFGFFSRSSCRNGL